MSLTDIADAIWDHPETRFEEFWSAERLAGALEAEGFTLTREAGGIPNAFIASYAVGNRLSPFGEYDALAWLASRRIVQPAIRHAGSEWSRLRA